MEKIEFKNVSVKKWLLIGIAGILMICGSYLENIGTKQENPEVIEEEADINNYKQAMERQLKQILSKVSGAGDVEVMITFKSTEEKVLKEDSEIANESSSNQTDNASSKKNEKNSTVIIENDGNEQPVIVMENYPVVCGVAVVAKGASDINVKNNIINIIKSLFEVEAHKISVTEMK